MLCSILPQYANKINLKKKDKQITNYLLVPVKQYLANQFFLY